MTEQPFPYMKSSGEHGPGRCVRPIGLPPGRVLGLRLAPGRVGGQVSAEASP